MEDEYKVVCALSNGATFDDLEWPRTPVSRSKYSLKANIISQTVHPIHSMFGSSQGYRGRWIERRYLRFDKIQYGGWRPSRIYNNGHNFATSLPIDVMFRSRVGFSLLVDTMVRLSMTLSDPKPQFQGHSIVERRISRKRFIRSTTYLVLG